MSEILSSVALIGSVAANLCRDIWLLGSYGLLLFGKTPEQVHSSTMPQKHNPLLFENAEGTSDLSTAILTYISTRLIQSCLHRDLSDSIIKRFYGTALALNLLALKNIKKASQHSNPTQRKCGKN
jgi:adenylosuccinate lyase